VLWELLFYLNICHTFDHAAYLVTDVLSNPPSRLRLHAGSSWSVLLPRDMDDRGTRSLPVEVPKSLEHAKFAREVEANISTFIYTKMVFKDGIVRDVVKKNTDDMESRSRQKHRTSIIQDWGCDHWNIKLGGGEHTLDITGEHHWVNKMDNPHRGCYSLINRESQQPSSGGRTCRRER
jgi:hypothetical protein